MTIGMTHILENRGATISVTALAGDGPTVVLPHGLAGSSRELLPTARALQGRRVLLVDQRGRGRSTRRPDGLSRAAFRRAGRAGRCSSRGHVAARTTPLALT